MTSTPDRFAKPMLSGRYFSRDVAISPEPGISHFRAHSSLSPPLFSLADESERTERVSGNLEEPNTRFSRPARFKQYHGDAPNDSNINNYASNNSGFVRADIWQEPTPDREINQQYTVDTGEWSEFALNVPRNSYQLSMGLESSRDGSFSKVRTPSSRLEIKPFGSAVDRERNEKCTTYGDDVFIEYNPMAFFGTAGSKMITKYFNDVVAGLAKEIPEFPDQISLKDYSSGVGLSKLAENTTITGNNIDWWADDINTYIEEVEGPELLEYLAKYNSSQTGYQPGALEQLIPDVVDKLTIADKLIKEYKQYIKPEPLDNKPKPIFRDPRLYETALVTGDNGPKSFSGATNITQDVPFTLNSKPTSLFSCWPEPASKREQNGLGGREFSGTGVPTVPRFQVARGYNNNTDDNNRFRIPTRNHRIQEDTAYTGQRIYYDDNCTIKISNLGDAHMLDVYDIKDFLREYGLDSDEIKYKVTLPRNKETGQARDFIYLNFCDDAGLSQALDILLGQRIVYEYGILSVERVEPRARR